jgi:phosphoserine phosphatase
MAEMSDKKQELEQLRNAEKKYQAYIERRNELNDYAKLLREERDMINNSHKELKDQMKTLKKERDELVIQMRAHKEIRNTLQKQAKELIEARRKRKGEVFKNLPLRVEELNADVQMLEYRQETVPMTSSAENELIDTIRQKKKEYNNVLKQLDKQKTIQIDISDKDNAIDELFKKADAAHEIVQKFYNESQQKHNDYMKILNELSVTIAESNKKHEQYIETRNEAQKNHEKALEMRSKIVEVRGDRRKRREEAKKIIQEQNIKAREAVMDKGKLQKIADDSLEALKKGQKISLK